MYGRAVISEGTDPHAILAPQQGVARDAKGEPTALVVGKDGKVAERVLTVSRAIGSDWLVTSGLKSGDRLIVEGTQKARPGMAVHAVAADLGTENAKPAPMKPKPGH
jgi:membrane fusion protein (multidrug efflux system)